MIQLVDAARGAPRAIAILVLAACSADAREWSGPWEVEVGAAHVQTFRTTVFVPGFYAYTALAVRGGEHEIAVVPLHLQLEPDRPGSGTGHPVFLLDRDSGAVDEVTLDAYRAMETRPEEFPWRRRSAYPQLRPAGARSGQVLVRPWKGRELVAVESWDSQEKQRLTFGLPSLIPFMGRQKFFERETFHTGTAFLQIFDTASPDRALVHLQQTFRDRATVPVVCELSAWVQGANAPLLVLTDPGGPAFLLIDAHPAP